jgi:cell division protein FtsB
VQVRLENFADVIGAEVGKMQTEIVKKLRAEIADLRAEIADLRQQKTGVVSLQHRRAS